MATYELSTPLSKEDVEKLGAGDIVFLTGTLATARDEAHEKVLRLLSEGKTIPVDFSNVTLYHCGPVVKPRDGGYEVIAAGPTTSMRMETFEPEFIEKTGVRFIIGKGGMGEKTASACRKHGCVYGAFTGGAAVLAASCIKKVKEVHWLHELGMPEALWVFEVERFGPLVITIDTHGENLTEMIKRDALARVGADAKDPAC